MAEPTRPDVEPFSLSEGGPFYSWMARAGMAAPGRRILLLIAITWLPLLVLSALNGTLFGGAGVPFLSDPAPYTRFLVAVPLLVVADLVIDRAVGTVLRQFSDAAILPEGEQAQMVRAVDLVVARRDRGWVEALLLVAAYALAFSLVDKGSFLLSEGAGAGVGQGLSSWVATGDGATEHLSPAGWWYYVVSAPLFQFLIFRWVWRYFIWSALLWRISRLDLQLEPTHPDLAGGLGILQMGQLSFGLVALAIGAFLSGVLGHEIVHLGSSLSDVKGTILGFGVLSLLILLAPLVVFAPKLGRTKRRGLAEYGALGSHLSRAFGERWTGKRAEAAELVDSPDPSALADYGACFQGILKMRTVPVSMGSVIRLAILLLLPFVPLVLTENSVKEVLRKLLGMIA